MNTIVFDDAHRANFLPLVYTRPVGMIRMGLFTTCESWKSILSSAVSCLAHPSLHKVYKAVIAEENWFINARLIPFAGFRLELESLAPNSALYLNGDVLAARCSGKLAEEWAATGAVPKALLATEYESSEAGNSSTQKNPSRLSSPILLKHLPDVFTYNEAKLNEDVRLSTHGRVSAPIDPTCIVLGDPGLVFIEPGAQVEACFLNTRKGPIYIGSDAQVMEGAVLHGPVAVMDHSVVRAGARIYGATTIGPQCKVAGEISNSVIFGYSNKAHDGFIGNAVIGEWCNLGADTNCSNLKNNYSDVSIWSYAAQHYVSTGLTFCGLIMGDHAKCGINTMFNTGTVVGVSANVFGGGFPPKYIPSFSWGGAEGFEPYDRDKAIETAKRAMARRQLKLTEAEEEVLRGIHDQVTVVE